MNEMRRLAEMLYSDACVYVDEAMRNSKWVEVARTLELAKSRLEAVRIILDLPPTDHRHSDAPAVAIEALQRASMLYGMAAGDLLGESAPKRLRTMKSNAMRQAANALHGRPGGSREKQAAIKAAWASGKYTSRDVCAEQECASLGVSFSAARKALRNTPDPT